MADGGDDNQQIRRVECGRARIEEGVLVWLCGIVSVPDSEEQQPSEHPTRDDGRETLAEDVGDDGKERETNLLHLQSPFP